MYIFQKYSIIYKLSFKVLPLFKAQSVRSGRQGPSFITAVLAQISCTCTCTPIFSTDLPALTECVLFISLHTTCFAPSDGKYMYGNHYSFVPQLVSPNRRLTALLAETCLIPAATYMYSLACFCIAWCFGFAGGLVGLPLTCDIRSFLL